MHLITSKFDINTNIPLLLGYVEALKEGRYNL